MGLPAITPDLLKQRAAAMAIPAPTLTPIDMSGGGNGNVSLPRVAMQGVRLPTQAETDTTKLNSLVNSGSGISQINNPLLRGLARTADIVGSVFGPTRALEAAIPGTELHHQVLVHQARETVANDQQQQLANAKLLSDQAGTENTEASTQLTKQKLADDQAPASPSYDYIDTPTGKMAILKGTTTASPVTVNGTPIAAPVKTPTTPFEFWQQHNPNGTLEDFNNLESKPLSADAANAMNGTFNGLAAKHGIPQNQFHEGMTHAEALQIQSSLNQAVSRQQGDTHISVQVAGQQQRAALSAGKNGALDLSSPDAQQTVSALAHGDIGLNEALPRGASFAQRTALVAAAKSINPDFNSGDHNIENAVRKDMTSGHDSNTLNAINTAYKHLDNFAASAKTLNGGDVKAFNQLANEMGVQVQSGASPQVVSSLVKEALKGEVARALTGVGATVDEQRNIDTSFSNANSLQTMLAVAGEAKSLLKGKEGTLRDKYNAGRQGKANFIPDAKSGSDPLGIR